MPIEGLGSGNPYDPNYQPADATVKKAVEGSSEFGKLMEEKKKSSDGLKNQPRDEYKVKEELKEMEEKLIEQANEATKKIKREIKS